MFKFAGARLAAAALSLAAIASTTWKAAAVSPQHDRTQFLASSRANASTGTGSPSADLQVDIEMFSRSAQRGTLSMAVQAFMDTIEDSAMGSDLAVLQMSATSSNQAHQGKSSPATLEEYCNKPASDGDPDEGDKVMADWKDYGTLYPGRVEDENRDDTYDIVYDDGWRETRVKENNVEEKEAEEKKEGKNSKPASQNDPACKLQQTLKNIKAAIKKLQEKIATWSLGQRAKLSGQRPGASSNAAAAPAPASTDSSSTVEAGSKADKLKKLKDTLAAKDAEANGLRQKVAENKDKLQGMYAPAAAPPAAPAPAKTVDDLIEEYKAKITARDREIEELKATLQQQEQELASLGLISSSLDDIHKAVDQLASDVSKAAKKRDELEKAGQLDPELRSGIEGITESMKLLFDQVKDLEELEKKAKEQKELAAQQKREAKKKAEAAAKEAAAAKTDEEKAKAKAAQEQAEAEAAEAEAIETASRAKVLEAAGKVERDLEGVEKGANKLDTGVHPHGDKWWRYRYEHSYVEALLMVIITLEMSFFGTIHKYFRNKAYTLAADPNKSSEEDSILTESQGYIYRMWLERFSVELMVCLNVFLTIWIASKTHFLDYLVTLMPSSDAYHLPNTGLEYKSCALDICVVLFFAVIFYYFLMLSVVHHSFKMTADLEELAASATASPSAESAPFSARTSTMMRRMNLKGNAEVVANFHDYFIANVESELTQPERALLYQEVHDKLGGDLRKFPITDYLCLNVRAVVPEVLTFGVTIWFPITLTFAILMLLHRFAAMGYLRIMCFFTVCLFIVFLAMFGFIQSVVKVVESGVVHIHGAHSKFSTATFMVCVLQYTMYMLCYGFARMVCQKWMWELHFWPVVTLTTIAVVMGTVFVLYIAPIIPEFSIAMCMPPYMDAGHINRMHMTVNSTTKGLPHQAASRSAQPSAPKKSWQS